MAPEPPGLTISEVARRTGIPVTTLRFYERELSGLFRIAKTSGGHRRYGAADVTMFSTVRRLTEGEGLRLADVRRVLMSPDEPEALRRDVERLIGAQTTETEALQSIERRVAALESRIAALEAGAPPRRGWLSRRRPRT